MKMDCYSKQANEASHPQGNAGSQAPICFGLGKHLQTWISNSSDSKNSLMFPIEASTPLTGMLIFKENEAELLLGVQPGKYLIVG